MHDELVIATKKLTKRYGSQLGVNAVDLHVPRGRIYGLLGRNGAGKTTIMRMLMGLAAPTSGEIRLFGTDSRRGRQQTYRRIGSIIETPGFYENLTGRENLEQRLGIAAAVMHEPELLILDEPINGLDPVGIAEVRGYLERLVRENGVTVLISSHILSEIEQLADIIGVMHEGRLIEEVSMQELHRRNRQYVEFVVERENEACLLLEERFQITDYSVHENGSLRVYTDFDRRAAINAAFVEAGIPVSKIHLSEEKLEDYFSNLIGGGTIG